MIDRLTIKHIHFHDLENRSFKEILFNSTHSAYSTSKALNLSKSSEIHQELDLFEPELYVFFFFLNKFMKDYEQ